MGSGIFDKIEKCLDSHFFEVDKACLNAIIINRKNVDETSRLTRWLQREVSRLEAPCGRLIENYL